jgi:hypothetical protein
MPEANCTLVGVIAPRVSVIAGVVVGFATAPDTPFAAVTETEVTVPVVVLQPMEAQAVVGVVVSKVHEVGVPSAPMTT